MVDFLHENEKAASRKIRVIGFRMWEIILWSNQGLNISLQDSYSKKIKRMKRLTILILISIVIFSCKNGENKEGAVKSDSLSTQVKAANETEYTCPMHPQVIRKEPGNCPECGMALQIRSWIKWRLKNEEWRMKNGRYLTR